MDTGNMSWTTMTSSTGQTAQRQHIQQQQQQQQHRRQQSTPMVSNIDTASGQQFPPPYTTTAVSSLSQFQHEVPGATVHAVDVATMHRRGLSLDDQCGNASPQSHEVIASSTKNSSCSPLDHKNSTVSIANTTDNQQQQQQQQQHMQVAQQNNQALPGNEQQSYQEGSPMSFQILNEQFRQFQHRQLDAQIDAWIRGAGGKTDSAGSTPSLDQQQHIVNIQRSRSSPDAYGNMQFVAVPEDRTRFAVSPILASMPSITESQRHALASNEENPSNQRPASSKSDGVTFGRVVKQQVLHSNAQQFRQPLQSRPTTPVNQSTSGTTPITPATTPYSARANIAYYESLTQSPQDLQHPSSPTLADATIRASKQTVKVVQSHSCSEVFDQNVRLLPSTQSNNSATSSPTHTVIASEISGEQVLGIDVVGDILPTPPNTHQNRTTRVFDARSIQGGAAFDSLPKLTLGSSPMGSLTPGGAPVQTVHSSPQLSGYVIHSSPEHQYMSDRDITPTPSNDSMHEGLPRYHSMNSIDATVQDTGVSPELVQSYIQEGLIDQKSKSGEKIPGFICVYSGCNREFQRKENVRSHVQTHLNDRQYVCLHCPATFVRQHDLKRHSATHSKMRSHVCACGSRFNRQDALTRHRQRGICAGGFEGVVKKTTKRGRPRKEKPTDVERVNKAALTRKRATAIRQPDGTMSSVDASPDSQYVTSPGSEAMMLDEDYGEMALLRQGTADGMRNVNNVYSFGTNMNQSGFVATYTPPMSPYSTGNTPNGTSVAATTPAPSSVSLEDNLLAAIRQDMEGSDRKSGAETGTQDFSGLHGNESQPGSPPGLSHSSPPTSTRVYDIDLPPSEGQSQSMVRSAAGNAVPDGFEFINMDLVVDHHEDDDIFTSVFNDHLRSVSTSSMSDKEFINSLSSGSFGHEFDDTALFGEPL